MATLGYIKDGVKGQVNLMPDSYPAERVSYDNTDSGLTATDIQDAIDELASQDTGHTIQNTAGTDLTQRPNLQFADMHTSDDSSHLRTVIKQIQAEMSVSDFESAQNLAPGFYLLDNGEVMTADMVKYGNSNVGSALDDLNSLRLVSPNVGLSSSYTFSNVPNGSYLVTLNGYDDYAYGIILAQKFTNGQTFVYKLYGANHLTVAFSGNDLVCSTDNVAQGRFVATRL